MTIAALVLDEAQQVRELRIAGGSRDDVQAWLRAALPVLDGLESSAPQSLDGFLFRPARGGWALYVMAHDAGLLHAVGLLASEAGHAALCIMGESFHGQAPWYTFTDFGSGEAPKTWWVDPLRGLNDEAQIKPLFERWFGTGDLAHFLSEELKRHPGTFAGAVNLVKAGRVLVPPVWSFG